MPLHQEALPLPADPRSVRRARAWVGEALDRLGRRDLVDSAELGVSELVTNALLHANSSIVVQIRGTRDHPRVEVRDGSVAQPTVNAEMADEEHLLSTIGRGLGIVALYSSTWGSEVARDGKTVWFEPAADLREDGDIDADVFDLETVMSTRISQAAPPEDVFSVHLLGMPVRIFAYFRRRYSELQRELRLLALAHNTDYPIARDFSELFLQVEQERRQSTGVEQLDAAIERDLERVDLEYVVPTSAAQTMAQLRRMLERADQFCREQRLLVLAATEQQRELQDWYFGEFERQARGEQPLPWSGGYTVGAVPALP